MSRFNLSARMFESQTACTMQPLKGGVHVAHSLRPSIFFVNTEGADRAVREPCSLRVPMHRRGASAQCAGVAAALADGEVPPASGRRSRDQGNEHHHRISATHASRAHQPAPYGTHGRPGGTLSRPVLRPARDVAGARRGECRPHRRFHTRAQELLERAYTWLEAHLADKKWAAGTTFSLADCAAGPALFYADWTHPISLSLPHVRAYRARLLDRPSFARAVREARPYRHLFPLGAPDRD